MAGDRAEVEPPPLIHDRPSRAGEPETLPLLDAYRIQEQLDALTREAAVEEELAAIKERAASSARPAPRMVPDAGRGTRGDAGAQADRRRPPFAAF